MRAIVLLAVLALAPVAGAHHCSAPSTSFAIEATGYYVYDACLENAITGDDKAGQECGWWGPWAVWIYQESNGIAGLQRADEMGDDTCHGLIEGDTVVL